MVDALRFHFVIEHVREYDLNCDLIGIERKFCPIRCWQHMESGGVFTYNEGTVGMRDVITWDHCKFHPIFG